MSVLELIGNTPLVEVTRLDAGRCRLFLKLEHHNPGGSIKDRIEKGSLIVEATAGNTGLGLALVAAQKGYRLLIVVPDKMSQEKIFHLRAMGAEIVLTRSDVSKGHPEYYQDRAAAIARATPGAFYVNQFANPANPRAHEESTGPEIWAQMQHDVDAVVAGVGTGGTLTGLSRFFAHAAPQTEIVLADPQGSILVEYVRTRSVSSEVGSWLVEGIGEDFIPPVCDLSRVKRAYSIADAEAFAVCRNLLKAEGIMAGTSSGTLIAAALRYCREQTGPKRVVSLVCDSGNKYLSKVYNDYWMLDHGFIERETGMVTAVLKGGLPASRRFLERCTLFTLAESLGGVESLVEHPAIMTHASLPEDVRANLGIDEGLVRLSVGIENVDDLIAELKHALA